METWLVIVIVVAAVALAVAAAWVIQRQRRRRDLHRTFGPEYERTTSAAEDRGEAERELEARRERRARFDIRPLAEDARRRYAEAWRLVQERFVDHPAEAVHDADELIQRVMAERGYPVDDFDQRAADLSVDHPAVVEDYRQGHAIAGRGDEASTEDLRRAMVHYRSLFNELLGTADRV